MYLNANFTRETHLRLRDCLKNIKGYFMLSYNDCPEIRELYKDFYIVEVSRKNNLKQRYEGGSEYKELLIMNYKSENTQLQLEI